MKNLLSLIAVLILSSPLLSQTTAVTATITDPDGQTWNNGTYTITFVPAQGAQQNPRWNGNPNFTQQFRGSLSAGGVLTVSLPDNGFITPPGSTWQFTLCSNTSAPCQNANQFVTGATQNLSTQLSNQLIAPRFGNGQFAFGYLDLEVVTPVQPGGSYWNVTSVAERIWNGSAWISASGSGTVTSIGTGVGLTGGPITGSGSISLISPVAVTNGGTGVTAAQGNGTKVQLSTGTTTSNDCVKFDANGNTVDAGAACGSGSGGFPSGVGLAGATTSGTGVTSPSFIPSTDIRWYFTTPFPNSTQATSQDFGLVLNTSLLVATAQGQCVDLSGLDLLQTNMYATTNPYVGMGTGTNPCIEGGNFDIVIGAAWESPAGALKIEGQVPSTLGTGLILQPCNTSPTCSGPGGFTVPQYTTSANCVSNGGLNCWATGTPGQSALTTYITGTVACTAGGACTGTGTTWSSSMVGGFFLSSCAANICTIGSTSSYVTGRIKSVGSTTALQLEGAWAGVTTSGENYIIFRPNTAVAFCDGCLTSSAQKASTGRLFRNFGIDNNGVGGLVGYFTRAVQEGTEYDNVFTTLQQNTVTAGAAGGALMVWDNTLREANGAGQTFTGHWYAQVLRGAVGQNAGGANSYGYVVNCFSKMDGSVAASAGAGPAEMHIAAVIGGSSNRFQDDLYIDGCFDGRYYGGHMEGALNDDIEVAPVNPVYGNLFEGFSSSGTLGNAVVELHSLSSGNQVKAITRPSGGILLIDDNLPTPTVATSVSGTPNSWTEVYYPQPGNGGIAIDARGGIIDFGTLTSTFNTGMIAGITYVLGAVAPGTSGAMTYSNIAPGVIGRAVTSSTGTGIVSTDCQATRIEYTGFSGAGTDTLPTATTLGLPNCAFKIAVPTSTAAGSLNTVTKVTITPTTWTANGAATLTVYRGQVAAFTVDPNSSTNWAVDFTDGGGSANPFKEYRALCQAGNVGLPFDNVTLVITNVTGCGTTQITPEWALPATTTATGATGAWYSAWTVPNRNIGSYTYILTYRSSATTNSATEQLAYACVAATGASFDNPSFTSIGSTMTLSPNGLTNPLQATVTFTPTCAAGSYLYLARTFTANTVASQLQFSNEDIFINNQ